jgi:pimeloyl-ACP methyl ester carboxylesterase
MNHRTPVLIIPGLGGSEGRPSWLLPYFWNGTPFFPVLMHMNWHDGGPFAAKERRIAETVRELKKRYGSVDLIGTSAGGSAALNVFFLHPEVIGKAVTVCARLRRGPLTGWRSFERATASSLAFRQSVERFEDDRLRHLTPALLSRIMTVRAGLGDELVPSQTAVLDGATNTVLFSGEHVLSIALALSFRVRLLTDFFGR